jgi:hypothetical protein
VLATATRRIRDPCGSLVDVAATADDTPPPLISQLAVHTLNILAGPCVSLVVEARGASGPLESARVIAMGTAARAARADAQRLCLARQPQTEVFAGFGRIADLTPADWLTGLTVVLKRLMDQMRATRLAAARTMLHCTSVMPPSLSPPR